MTELAILMWGVPKCQHIKFNRLGITQKNSQHGECLKSRIMEVPWFTHTHTHTHKLTGARACIHANTQAHSCKYNQQDATLYNIL
jgi:hypothetical protein